MTRIEAETLDGTWLLAMCQVLRIRSVWHSPAESHQIIIEAPRPSINKVNWESDDDDDDEPNDRSTRTDPDKCSNKSEKLL